MTDAVEACIALGSNLGERAVAITAAIDHLHATDGIVITAVSSMYETDPIGPGRQPKYLNAAAVARTNLPARNLLNRMLEIESMLGRARQCGQKWGPRSIDLDLLLYGDRIIDEPGLRVPHPRMHERAFVLDPLCEIAPNKRHPALGRSVESIRRSLYASPASTVE